MLPGSVVSLPLVQFEQFEGPLDLLLDQVRQQNVSIENIAMAPIVARYLEYVQTAAERNLSLDIEWLHLAARLIHWKSRALLPPAANAHPDQDPILGDLVQQLLAHKKQAAAELAIRRSVEDARFSRERWELGEDTATDQCEESPFVSVWDMIQQARELGRWLEQHSEDRRHVRETFDMEQDEVTVVDMIDYLKSRFADEGGELNGVSLLQEQPTVSHRFCLFLGMLEMVRDQQVQMEQDEPFGPIWLLHNTDLS